MKIIDVRLILSQENGLDVIKDIEEENEIKLIKTNKKIKYKTSNKSVYSTYFKSRYNFNATREIYNDISILAIYNTSAYNSEYSKIYNY